MRLARQVDRFFHQISPYLDCGLWSDPDAARKSMGEMYVFLLKRSGEILRLRRSCCQWLGPAADAWNLFIRRFLSLPSAFPAGDLRKRSFVFLV